jgi:hypothetical protein
MHDRGGLDHRIDLHSRMRRAGRRAADQQRLHHAAALHFGGDVDHLIEAWRDQAGQANHVDLLLLGRVENGSAGTMTPRSIIS